MPSGHGTERFTGVGARHARDKQPERSAIERHAAMICAKRLKRVFGIDLETCVRCSKAVKVIACIEESALVERILVHVRGKGECSTASLGPPSTGPPLGA
jgi:hypothetical protein